MSAARVLFVDGSGGAAGDMLLGAFVELGVPLAKIRAAVGTLPIRGYRLSARKVLRSGIAATQVRVDVKGRQPERNLREIQDILEAGRLDPAVRARAVAIFRRLVEAEAKVHGRPVARTHLHEVGAVDAIVDVVGACVALAHLAPRRIVVSRLTTGFGSVTCEHGVYPVPAPATALLLRGVPCTAGAIEGERLTPTGAAILTTIADSFGELPSLRPLAIGYGSGTKEFSSTPNVVRMLLGESDDAAVAGTGQAVVVVEAVMDDAPPQSLAYASERLFETGALDVHVTPVQMKKGRAGHLLTILTRAELLDDIAAVVFRETTTLGLRFRREERIELDRRIDRVTTPLGPIRVKVGLSAGTPVQIWPEYDDCAAAARRHKLPLKEVQQFALHAHAHQFAEEEPPRRPQKARPAGRHRH
jgi:uncharacterized protein (TIGR00299 family) protein